MFRNVITSLFLDRFRPNFRTSFSINKSITHNQISTVSEDLKIFFRNLANMPPKKVVLEAPLRKVETQKFDTTFPLEKLYQKNRKVKKFQAPILSRFP